MRRLAALGLGLVLWGCSLSTSEGDPGAIAPAPDFTLPDLDGNPVRMAGLRGRTVVIDFWATWCPPCIFQVPELNALWRAHRETGDVAVIGIAVDVEGAKVVRPWAEEHGIEYAVLLGDENLAREFGVLGFPTLVLVNPEGGIESLHVGIIEHDELEELVAGVRSPPAPSRARAGP